MTNSPPIRVFNDRFVPDAAGAAISGNKLWTLSHIRTGTTGQRTSRGWERISFDVSARWPVAAGVTGAGALA
jgi:hypothetical protein